MPARPVIGVVRDLSIFDLDQFEVSVCPHIHSGEPGHSPGPTKRKTTIAVEGSLNRASTADVRQRLLTRPRQPQR
jgi:hypothetical protein